MPGPFEAPGRISNQLQEQLCLTLKTALSVTGDKGNLQLFDPADCSLKIAVQSGFGEGFLSFFRGTQEGHAACGMALLRRDRVVVEDVESDPIFLGTEAREVLLREGVRAVQSTPLLNRAGSLVGILSTHYQRPIRPGAAELRMIDTLAHSAARMIHPPFCGLPEDEKVGDGYSVFCRTSGCVSFVGSVVGWRKALQRLKRLSQTEPGEFVLFHHLNVAAVSQGGIVDVRWGNGKKPSRD